VLQPESEYWFAQSYPEFLRAYDYSVVMAMPGLENISDKEADAWLRKLAGKVVAIPGALGKTIFELQAKDWRDGKFVDTSILGKQMHIINSAGIFNFGYYPDNFLNNQPALNRLRPFISLETFPYERDWR
jgi:biofilm PGA synthesis lipoprotein PgaB